MICIPYLIPNFSFGLAMTFSVTGLPHYQQNGFPESGRKLELDVDQGSWFGTFVIFDESKFTMIFHNSWCDILLRYDWHFDGWMCD